MASKYELAKFQDGNIKPKANANANDIIDAEKLSHNIILAERTESFTSIDKNVNKKSKNIIVLGGKDHITYPEMGKINGVLLPFLQSNTLGAILFLRLPYITGQAGVLLTSIIFIICAISTSLTLLSLSALASNGKLNKSGGLYQLISRNLGVELGGAVGLLFYVGKCLAGSMYFLGAAEAFLTGLGLNDKFPWINQVIALIMCLILTLTAHVIQTKHIDVVGIIFLGIASLTILFITIGGFAFADRTYYASIGRSNRIDNDNAFPQFLHDPVLNLTPTFFSMLALYYPSVTGIMTGSATPGSFKY